MDEGGIEQEIRCSRYTATTLTSHRRCSCTLRGPHPAIAIAMMSKFVDKVAVIVGAYFRHKASGAENGRSFYAIVTRAENEIASNRLLWALLGRISIFYGALLVL